MLMLICDTLCEESEIDEMEFTYSSCPSRLFMVAHSFRSWANVLPGNFLRATMSSQSRDG